MLSLDIKFSTEGLKRAKFAGDYTRYQQILLNVLHNAVKFSPISGTISVSISHEVVNEESKSLVGREDGKDFQQTVVLSVIVQDEGPGIREED